MFYEYINLWRVHLRITLWGRVSDDDLIFEADDDDDDAEGEAAEESMLSGMQFRSRDELGMHLAVEKFHYEKVI